MGLRGAHLDMSGNVLSGQDETGKPVRFAQPSMLPQRVRASAPEAAVPPLPNGPVTTNGMMAGGVNYAGAPIPAQFPRPAAVPAAAPMPTASAMTTGHPAVTFPSPAERAASMNADAQARFAAGKSAVFAAGRAQTLAGKRADAGIVRQESGAVGGLITGQGTATPKLTSVYGSGSVRAGGGPTQTGFPTRGRIVDETGDRTAEFAQRPASNFPKRRTA